MKVFVIGSFQTALPLNLMIFQKKLHADIHLVKSFNGQIVLLECGALVRIPHIPAGGADALGRLHEGIMGGITLIENVQAGGMGAASTDKPLNLPDGFHEHGIGFHFGKEGFNGDKAIIFAAIDNLVQRPHFTASDGDKGGNFPCGVCVDTKATASCQHSGLGRFSTEGDDVKALIVTKDILGGTKYLGAFTCCGIEINL